jgi:DNA-binding IclR family transcriptional regulator
MASERKASTSSSASAAPRRARRPPEPDSTTDATASGAVRSVQIAVSVLECFLATPELGATEVARRVGVAKSTAHRVLVTLAASGLLDRTGGGRYRLGIRLYDYGQLAIDRLYLRELALPVLAELRDQIGETVQLGIPSGAEVLYVDRLEGTNGLRFHSGSYRRVPGHSSSTGKAIAAFNPTVREAVLEAGFVAHTTRTPTTRGAYLASLDEIRRKGYAASIEEFEVGLSSVAAPILLSSGRAEPLAVAAISVAGPTPRVNGRGSVVAARVVDSAKRVTRRLERALQATP